MPYLQMQTSAPFDEQMAHDLCAQMSAIVAKTLAKPEAYVMVSMSKADFVMNAQDDPAAFIDLRSIGGLDANTNRELSASLSALIAEKLKIPSQRLYLNFANVNRENWGYDGGTFA